MILKIFQETFEDIPRFDDTIEIVTDELCSFLPIAMDIMNYSWEAHLIKIVTLIQMQSM